LGIGDWGLGIGDWGLGPIPNPHFFQIKIKNNLIKLKYIINIYQSSNKWIINLLIQNINKIKLTEYYLFIFIFHQDK